MVKTGVVFPDVPRFRVEKSELFELHPGKSPLSLNNRIRADIWSKGDHRKQKRNGRKNSFRIQIDSRGDPFR